MLGYGAIALLSLQGALGDKYRKEGSLKDMVFFGSVSLSSCSLVLMCVRNSHLIPPFDGHKD